MVEGGKDLKRGREGERMMDCLPRKSKKGKGMKIEDGMVAVNENMNEGGRDVHGWSDGVKAR